MIVGLEKPNAGKVFVNGEDVTELPMYQRSRFGIGYLPQEASVFRKLTVEDNLLAILETTNFSKAEQHEKNGKACWQSLKSAMYAIDLARCYQAANVAGVEIARSLATETSLPPA